MAHKRLYLSTALLFAVDINNNRCKIVEHNKCNDMANCSFRSKKSSSVLLVHEQQASQK